MSAQKLWARWTPIPKLSEKYYIDAINDTAEGLKIILSEEKNEKKNLQIVFDSSVHSCMNTNETFRLKAIYTLREKYNSEFYTTWTFFKVTNSRYVKWVGEQSLGIVELESLTHFSIVSVDSVVDIVAAYEPKVEFIAPL
jgi:hypothetical protein